LRLFLHYNQTVNLDDTIVAIATPPGRGGIGVVRLAGAQARAIAEPMLRLRHQLAAGHASLGELIDPKGGDRVDEVVVTFFAKPHSYTTDDIVEICAHGAPVVLEHVVSLAIERGARLAEPGEFTMRAFLNGRLDLTQAEAVRDLIESQTLFQAKVAAQQLEGSLSKRLKPMKQKLVDLIAVLEAGVDFAEDDVSVLPGPEILSRMEAVRAPLEELVQSFSYGKIIHEGLTLAIVGRPNVGKSSLFNRLVERERAIVTSTPGTTRDLVTETVSLGGIPVRLVDTAGLRRATDEAESIGIQKSYEALADADLVLVVLDATEAATDAATERATGAVMKYAAEHAGVHPDRAAALRSRLESRAAILVQNKSDLVKGAARASGNGRQLLRTSALTGEGIPELREAILKQISGSGAVPQEGGMLTNARHQGLVRDSLNALAAAAVAVASAVPHEMLLLDLYSALRPLDAITGATTTDDILNLIFSSFCIGK
jgi:tRNA modification GTPase